MEVGALNGSRGLAQASAKANEKASSGIERAKDNQEREEVAASNEEARAAATGSGRNLNRTA